MKFYELNKELTLEDLKEYNYPNRKLGVIVHIIDKDKNILLQQRGVKSRDENGLYEDVCGKFDNEDQSFREAIAREMFEEMGENAKVELGRTLGVYHCFKNDINWVFVIFEGQYIDGEIKIMEPDKCLGYKFFAYEEALTSPLLSESCKFLIKEIKEKYDI
ncbi:MAG: NUDIX hydrolase [Ruminococcus sp.]|nr:NUDIX hydrolase [Ruminococcus sp.]